MLNNDSKFVPADKTNLNETIDAVLVKAKSDNDRAFVTALGRGVLVLSVFEHEQSLSHQQICSATGLAKATVSRLIHTLELLDLLKRTDDDRYRLGKSLLKLSSSVWRRYSLVDDALPLLKDFARAHQVSVNIGTEIEGDIRYVACCRSPARLAVNLAVGSSVPVEQTAIGRAYYAALPTNFQQQLLDSLPFSEATTERLKAAQILDENAQFYEQHGYCLSDGEFSPDILAVGIPLYDRATGKFTHALNASVPKANWVTEEYVDYIVPKIKQLATQIEDL
ncbi:IclR family transcriptional regulator [Psychrobacter pygoscelis]|uniref:IclR family transcriptional regulator n=1 Tax=Psychrobacter pygoscelis TaxID=2488563 RepID=UPI00103BFBFB|nr:IclR family transcriptional regulator [Psychrobacter pygoscelis]